jgi:hypothetical protein
METDGSKKHPELKKRDKKVAELAGDCRELRIAEVNF